MSNEGLFIGVDVGTGSARAGLFTLSGKLLESAAEEIQTWNPQPDHFEQSSENIWTVLCRVVQKTIRNYPRGLVKGIGFDATCSLVILDGSNRPLTVSSTGNSEQNVILWMDHRAKAEAERINASKDELLRYVGGKVSLEMELPKLLWLKGHLPDTYRRIGRAFDLPDFLTFKATDVDSRSICSTVCKWNYDGVNGRWSGEFLRRIGLAEMAEGDFRRIGEKILNPGDPVGQGLCQRAAKELGLEPGIHVGTSIIDAHAGALALFGAQDEKVSSEVTSRMALICGTSTCHMSVTREPVFAAGIWGPYRGAILPQTFLNEAGQSATGLLVDHLIKIHPRYEWIRNNLAGQGSVYEYLNDLLETMRKQKGLGSVHELTKSVHVWPDFHGNRSPVADSDLRGMISGLTIAADEENLATIYLATIQALAYGTKHILDALEAAGREKFSSILICGGLSKNQLFVQTHADVCSIPVLLPESKEAVLLGAAMLGACASGTYPNLETAVKAMGGKARLTQPDRNCAPFHEKKYKVFLKLLSDQIEYRRLMNV